MRMRLASTLLLMSLAMTAKADEPASVDTFEREALRALKAAFVAKKSVYLHVNGETIAGAVKAIGPDVIVTSNREHATILIRREKIDAIEAD